MSSLCLIKLPDATFNIVVKKGKVVEAPSIAKWMIDKYYFQIEWWVKERKGDIKRC